jgi:hypothetical protein
MVTNADGTVVSQTSITVPKTDTHAIAMAGHVIRMMRTGNVAPEHGQRLTVWFEDDPLAHQPCIHGAISSTVGKYRYYPYRRGTG